MAAPSLTDTDIKFHPSIQSTIVTTTNRLDNDSFAVGRGIHSHVDGGSHGKNGVRSLFLHESTFHCCLNRHRESSRLHASHKLVPATAYDKRIVPYARRCGECDDHGVSNSGHPRVRVFSARVPVEDPGQHDQGVQEQSCEHRYDIDAHCLQQVDDMVCKP